MVHLLSSVWEAWLPFTAVGFLSLGMMYDIAGMIDLIIFIGFALLRNWRNILHISQSLDLRPLFGLARGVVAAVLLIQVGKYWKYLERELIPKLDSNIEVPKPLLFPSRTSHTRFFPKTHSFSYSYLLAGIPVGWKGSVGGMLAADQSVQKGSLFKMLSRSLYSVNAEDYLDRGYGHLGLEGKLKKYLESQGIDHEDYPFAYMMTAPRFLGYSFNPVSFWYLYSANKELTAMILEVNNTFDERRMYFLKPADSTGGSVDSSEEIGTNLDDLTLQDKMSAVPETHSPPRRPTRFTQSWAKDFHVSPFNSRKGSYLLVAYDPLFPSMSGRGPVSSTIILKSSKGHSKLVARIFSEGTTLDPAKMTLWQKVVFGASWWWVGFVTFPRIVREAGKLFFRRKLHVWFRPEPLKESMGRHADIVEQQLEASFRNYLRYLVETAPSALIVKYTAAGIVTALEETMKSDAADDDPSRAAILDFKVLTPVFYSRFVHYAHDMEAIFSEFNESGTIWLSQPSLLPPLVIKRPQPPHETPSWTNYVMFKVIQKLRRRPSPIEAPSAGAKKEQSNFVTKSDIRNFRISAMDAYILGEGEPAEQKTYRWQVLRLFIGDRVAFGSVDVLKVELFLIECAIAWAAAGRLGPLFSDLLDVLSTK